MKWWWGVFSLEQAVIQGVGVLASALIAHQIYVRRYFVERGDPALAWLVVAWSIALLPALPEGVRSWSAMIFAGFSLHVGLQSHRQPSTSAIQFRSGALAGLAVVCDPACWGIIPGLMLMQINTRPAILREWLMLAAGLAWAMIGLNVLIAWAMPGDAVRFLVGPTMQAQPGLILWSVPVWAAIGAIRLLAEQPHQILRIQNARLSSLLFFGSLALCSAVEFGWDGTLLVQVGSIMNHPALAMGLAFFTVQLIPKRDRHIKKKSSWQEAFFWLFVGTLLVLFIAALLR